MKYPKLREVVEAVKAVAGGPYTSAFPGEPHVPPESFRGQPRFDPDACLGCLACEEVCPAHAIKHEDHVDAEGGARRVMIHLTDACIFCGQCEEVCINDHRGIRLTREWDLACFDRRSAQETIEKPLQLCEACGAVVATVDHLLWLAHRLGPRSFSSPTLYLTHLTRLGISDTNLAAPVTENARSDRFKILCAACRRRTTLS